MVLASVRTGLARAVVLGIMLAVLVVDHVHADTKAAAPVEGSNNIVLLVAALGVLVGVLIVTRSRPGPKS